MAEVDYTNQVQQSFSFETLTQFLEEGKNSIDPEIWKEIDNKPYITKSNLDSQPYVYFSFFTNFFMFGVLSVFLLFLLFLLML